MPVVTAAAATVAEKRAPPGSRLATALWSVPLDAMSGWKAALIGPARVIFVLVRDMSQGQLTLRATGLVYTTLLSLVPLLALSFSVLKAFGVYNQIQPLLLNFLAPLGDSSAVVSRWIIGFIESLNVGVLGSIGLALLIYTALSLMQKIEESFNFIWHVPQLRSYARRFSGYLSVLLIGPVLVFSVLGATSGFMRTPTMRGLLATEPLGAAVYALGQAIPLLVVIGAFTFAYIIVPNTRVRPRAALTGGAVAGTLWQAANWTFAAFVAKSTQLEAIYSSFAIMVLFLIWLYVNWLILLLGASIAFYRQHPEYVIPLQGEPRLSNRMRERLALMTMYLVGAAYHAGDPAWTFAGLARRLHVPMHALRGVLSALEARGLVVQTGDDPPGYLPSRDTDSIALADLLDAVRTSGEEDYLGPDAFSVPAELESVLEARDRAAAAQVQGLTLRAVLDSAAGSVT